MLLYHLLQHHTLTGFFQKDAAVSSNFLQNTVCKTLKAQDINIQDSLPGLISTSVFWVCTENCSGTIT